MAGKGHRNRTSDHQAFRDGWERAFGGKEEEPVSTTLWETIVGNAMTYVVFPFVSYLAKKRGE